MNETKPGPQPFGLFAIVAAVVVLAPLVGAALQAIPGVTAALLGLFDRMGPFGQAQVLSAFVLGLICFAVMYVVREDRVRNLKAERDLLEAQLRSKEAELKQVEENNIRLAEEGVKEDVWQRDVVKAPPFVDRAQRGTRFIAVLNLKGGVGKTTLAASLGAALALDEPRRRVLLVDLDFQATLSEMCAAPDRVVEAHERDDTASLFLRDGLTVERLLRALLPVNLVPGAKVLISTTALERDDVRSQAHYFLQPGADVRFLFRSVLHDRAVLDQFDIVLFDCPPRLTTSTVNALTCSDYVLIPTKLDERSFEAIPRTLRFLTTLETISRARVLGVVANEVQYWRRGTLIKAHQRGLGRLRQILDAADRSIHVFEPMVELSNDLVAHSTRGTLACVAPEVRARLFSPLAAKIRERLD